MEAPPNYGPEYIVSFHKVYPAVAKRYGVPLVPFRMYKVDDGTGEVTILSQSSRMPATGEHVRVKGRVEDIAMLGGRALGLHIREEGLYVKR